MDFAAMAARLVAGLEDVRACLLMSRDGLTLGVHPEGGEARARGAWDRLAGIGDPERGFLVVGDEIWVISRRGSYAGVVVAKSSLLPGLLLDHLELLLRRAEEARTREPAGAPPRSEPPRSVRSPLHRVEPERTALVETPAGDQPVLLPEVAPGAEAALQPAAPPSDPSTAPRTARFRDVIGKAKRVVTGSRVEPNENGSRAPEATEPEPRSEPTPRSEDLPKNKAEPEPPHPDPEAEVDPVALAREFSALFRDDDET